MQIASWHTRDDVGGDTTCLTGLDAAGNPLIYVQVFPDSSAAYWFHPMEQAKPTKSLVDVRIMIDRL
jgi:hypothetical protein